MSKRFSILVRPLGSAREIALVEVDSNPEQLAAELGRRYCGFVRIVDNAAKQPAPGTSLAEEFFKSTRVLHVKDSEAAS